MKTNIKLLIKKITHIHLNNSAPNIILFSTPRSGSTWLMEILANQKRAKSINEPFNLREPLIRKFSGIEKWEELINKENVEKLSYYINSLASGKMSFKNPRPTSSYYRPIVDHSVIKILHGGDNLMNELVYHTNSKAVYLLRHPIPVAQSRKQLPRLESFVFSGKMDVSAKIVKFSKEIFNKGDVFEKSILDWCYQNYFGLKQETKNYSIVSYENLVADPEPIFNNLAKLGLIKDIELAKLILLKPSKSTTQSSGERKKLLSSESNKLKREKIILKWQDSVKEEQIKSAQKILDQFEIEYYKADSPYPTNLY